MTDTSLLIPDDELYSFAENLKYKSNTIAGQLFPDMKTASLEAVWYDISDGGDLPVMSLVHGFDTESNIGSRKPFREIKLQKMLVKEKINQSEKLQMLLRNGVTAAEKQIDFIYNDFARLGANVYSRFDVMRCELLTSGSISVVENNQNYVVDYQVPAGHKKAFDWANAGHDILSDIQAMVDTAEDAGKTINTAITSPSVLRTLLANTEINRAINGTTNLGILVTREKLNSLMDQMFGFTITVDKSKYQYQTASGDFNTTPYFSANKFVLAALGSDGTLGKCIWGETPEEFQTQQKGGQAFNNYVFMNQKEEWDPVALWTKAAAIAIPALRDSRSLVIGDITLPAGATSTPLAAPVSPMPFSAPASIPKTSDGTLRPLTVTSAPGTSVGETILTVTGATGALVYKVTNSGSTVTYGKVLADTIDAEGASPFTLDLGADSNGKIITVVEVNTDRKSVTYGTATVAVKV
ncbi:MAG: major capsid protein [Methanosarcinales archaeon]|jgi:hypothetical protein|nr:major capsid protein [Methanosarcinales archaeon]